MIRLQIKMFGAFRKYVATPEIEVEVEPGLSVSELRQAFIDKIKTLNPRFSEEGLVQDSAFANERRVLGEKEILTESAKVAILPPVCGG